jgi:hypothetical protein
MIFCQKVRNDEEARYASNPECHARDHGIKPCAS